MVELGFPKAPTSVIGLAQSLDVGGTLVRRWFGTVVDLVFLALVLFLPALLLGGGNNGEMTLIVTIPAILAYYPVTEGIWGRTLGKLASGTIVVDETGKPPGVLKAILRTLARLIEVNPFLMGGIPAGIVVALSPRRQRLGDMMAGTYVVPFKDISRINAPETVFS